MPGSEGQWRYPVDGALVVSRTRDGGESFDVLRDGLPQQHAYDVVYRHGLDIDADGATLAFGSTTGNLFVSEDQGDHWQTAQPATLPPIYCVRFRELTGARALQPQCRMSALAQSQNNCPSRPMSASPKRSPAYVDDSKLDAIPRDVRDEAKRAIVNYLGCALGGSIEPALDVAIETLSALLGRARRPACSAAPSASTRCTPRS